jgi:hypothetical protein
VWVVRTRDSRDQVLLPDYFHDLADHGVRSRDLIVVIAGVDTAEPAEVYFRVDRVRPIQVSQFMLSLPAPTNTLSLDVTETGKDSFSGSLTTKKKAAA